MVFFRVPGKADSCSFSYIYGNHEGNVKADFTYSQAVVVLQIYQLHLNPIWGFGELVFTDRQGTQNIGT